MMWPEEVSHRCGVQRPLHRLQLSQGLGIVKVQQKSAAVSLALKDCKAFYMRLNEDGKTVAAMDLLCPGSYP